MALYKEVHETSELVSIHPPYKWQFDTAELREAASIPPTDNLTNFALQKDDNSSWMLINSVESLDIPGTFVTTWKSVNGVEDFSLDLVAIYNLYK